MRPMIDANRDQVAVSVIGISRGSSNNGIASAFVCHGKEGRP
jgi:hypothetical protein